MNKWTEEEILFIKNNIGILSYTEMSKIINRTSDAISTKIAKLNLQRRHDLPWREEEIEILRAYYKKLSYKELADKLSRTVQATQNKIFSLGLKKTEQHDLSNVRTYRIWAGIKRRCLNKNGEAYNNYGGRGIAICEEWINSFISFHNWAINNGYQDHLTIERIDVNGNYCPENCKWIEKFDQAKNKRTAIKVVAFGEEKTLVEWYRDNRCKINYTTLYTRICVLNWDPEEAILKEAR